MNKEKERDILKAIYDLSDFDEVISYEKPDFKIRIKNSEMYFGVEITEFYFSESNARMRNIDGYIGELLDEGKYRHKDDVYDLEIVGGKLISSSGKEQDIKAVFKELPTLKTYVEGICQKIREKNNLLAIYDPTLTHVNLIILDTELRLSDIQVDYFYKFFYTSELKSLLCQTGFQEVFVITSVKGHEQVYYPLKLLLLFAEFYLFDALLIKYYSQIIEDSIEKELELFLEYLLRLGAKGVYTRIEDGNLEIIVGKYGIVISDDKTLNLRDYGEYRLPRDVTPYVVDKKSPIFDEVFEEQIKNFSKGNVFETGLIYNVKKKVVF